jgi:hypothetical protein
MAAATTDDVPHFNVSTKRELPLRGDALRLPFSVEISASEAVLRGGIAANAFEGCSGLTTITIPEGCTMIGLGAFAGCRGLTSLNLPESCTEIGDHAFSYCSGLTSLNLPEGCTEIEEYLLRLQWPHLPQSSRGLHRDRGVRLLLLLVAVGGLIPQPASDGCRLFCVCCVHTPHAGGGSTGLWVGRHRGWRCHGGGGHCGEPTTCTRPAVLACPDAYAVLASSAELGARSAPCGEPTARWSPLFAARDVVRDPGCHPTL